MDTMLGNIELPDRLYFKFVNLIYDAAGISLGDAKRDLLRSRLLKRVRALGLRSFQEYWDLVGHLDAADEEFVEMLDAVATNKTEFFRDSRHFRFLAESLLPALAARAHNERGRRLRFWCAGCSSGEEAYSLAIVVRQSLSAAVKWNIKVLATDISARMLRIAREGVYEEGNLGSVPPRMRSEYFEKTRSPEQTLYRVRNEIRKTIAFRRLNLMEREFPFSGPFNAILCRNVMIYFDKRTRQKLVRRFHDYLAPGGYLFLGHGENLNSLDAPFKFVKPTIYLRP